MCSYAGRRAVVPHPQPTEATWTVHADNRTTPDVLCGVTYVGLVAFRMHRVGWLWSPGVPYLGSFPETNVRLYSVDAHGRRGVVFRSMDAGRLGNYVGRSRCQRPGHIGTGTLGSAARARSWAGAWRKCLMQLRRLRVSDQAVQRRGSPAGLPLRRRRYGGYLRTRTVCSPGSSTSGRFMPASRPVRR
jgi:hypothetical protein